jgi:DNA-binding LacI/PurR family transcriptional regulator
MRPSLQTIATRLGINRGTVSRALRDEPWVSDQTKERVRAMAKEIGYRPNSIISELASSRWQDTKVQGTVIGYIVRTPKEGIHGVDVIEHLTRNAERLGYRLEPFFREDYESSAKLQRVLRNRGITDIILGPMLDSSFAVELDWENFICIQLLPGYFPLPLHTVVRDHFNKVVMCWEKCVSRGYGRIGITLLDHPFRVIDDVLRMSAIEACQKHMFGRLVIIPPFHTDGIKWKVDQFVRWVKRHQLDVVIGFNGYFASFLRDEFGERFPFCALNLNLDQDRSISGVPDPGDDLGREAINLLHFCRRTNQWGLPKHRIGHVIEPQWHEGTTLPEKQDLKFKYPYPQT